MPGHGLPKLVCAFSRARMYTAMGGGIALFWRGRPVALFPDLEAAVSYVYSEFVDLKEPSWDKG
tara:strand:- start:407 stop:598 length:192 start_codon:yes stop_codon:yes gene_type:complete